jgi:tRNA threonylcarbamoyl adenosine modification protein (Sua5/YciO/YrdC/YwlC family)
MRLRVEAQRPDPRHVTPAVEALRRGQVIIYPTDTGYAFGCALTSGKGIATLRRLKGIHAKHEKPLTMLVADLSDVGRYGVMGNDAFRFVRRLLPGPYTMVLRATSDVPRAMRNRQHEVGLRMPDHALCAMLVRELGEPLLTGSVTPAEEIPELEDPDVYVDRYQGDVAVVLDAGPLWPDPSTVLRFTERQIEVLREGQGPLPDWAA